MNMTILVISIFIIFVQMMVIIIVIVIAILFIVKEQQPEQLVLLFDGSSLNAKRNSIAQTYESTSKDGGHYPF